MKKRLWLIVILTILIVSLAIVDTYALFETNASADNEFDIGAWTILLNNVDVSLNSTVNLSSFQYSSNSHTADGYLSPGRSAYFDIEIDASNVDVSVEYTLSIDTSQIEDYPNIILSIKNMDTNEEIVNDEYNGVILLSDTDKTVSLRIFLTWQNNPLYDESDTSLIGEDINFVLDANFIQYLGE